MLCANETLEPTVQTHPKGLDLRHIATTAELWTIASSYASLATVSSLSLLCTIGHSQASVSRSNTPGLD
jgi:hypothetical protein